MSAAILPSERIRVHRSMNLLYLKSTIATLLFALPLGLLWASGPLLLLGVAYSILWVAIVVPAIGAYTWLLFDAMLITLNRPPIFLTGMIARLKRVEPRLMRRSLRRVQRYARFAVWVNPLSNVVLAAFRFAGRVHPERLMQAFVSAEELVERWAREQEPPSPEAAGEISRPVVQLVEEFERDLAAAACY